MLNNDKVAMSMLAMAETLRTQHPPKLKMAMKCARGALKLDLSKETEAHCHLQLGKLLFYYTDHFEMARGHLQLSYDMLSLMGEFHVLRRLEALSLLCELYIHSLQWPLAHVCNLIRKELSHAREYNTYYYKLLFYFIEAIKLNNNVQAALDACNVALKTTSEDKPMELYFRITKHLISYQMLREEPDAQEVLHIGAMIKELEANPAMTFHLRNIKGFFMCTKLAFMLSEGQSRTSRTLLRQIQQEVSTKTKSDVVIEGIRWMDETAMTVFACVMNVVSALVQCSYDRAYKYHMNAVKHADDIITKSTQTPQEFGVVRCVNQMKMASLELMALCNVMACRPEKSLSNMHEMIIYSVRAGGQLLYDDYAPHLQYILGLLSCYFQQNEAAEKHFLSAIKMLSENPRCNKNSICLLHVNLAMCYLNQMKLAEYYDVAEQLSPARISDCSPMVKNNVKFLNAFYFYLNHKTNDCKHLLQEMLQGAKAEDFFRLHGLALLMLSLLVQVDEAMVKPTVDWSKKSYDHVVVLWSHSFYAQLLERRGQNTTEIMEEVRKSTESLSVQHLFEQINKTPAENLLQWFEGDANAYLPKDDLLM